MSFDPGRIETITVDSYGTLVDPSAAERALADVVDHPEPVSNLWRSRSLTYTMVANEIDRYQTFYEMNRDALQFALDQFGVDLEPDQRNEILSVYHRLDVYDDVREGIERIIDQGYEVYVVSNGNPDMLSSMIEHASIGDLIEDAISADEIETFKPNVEIYRHAAARTGTPIRNIAHVSGPGFDVQGAKHAGMQGIWLKRGEKPWEAFGPEPDLTIDSFYELAEELEP